MPGKRGPDKKPRKPRPNKKEPILRAAIRVFAHYGYDGASFDRIAEEAGVAKSLVIKYYESKENLAHQCVMQLTDSISREIQSIDKYKTPYPQHVEQVADIFKKYRDEMRFLVGLMVTPSNAHLATAIMQGLYGEKYPMMRPYEDRVQPGKLDDLIFCMAGLHFMYIIGANEQMYDSARHALAEKFVLELQPPAGQPQG